MVQVNVVDMDEALNFYCSNLGFEVASTRHYPEIVQLNHEGFYFLVYLVPKPTKIDYGQVAQTMINIEVDDVERAAADLRRQGVEVLHDSPQECPAGRYVAFRDPFGKVHEWLELDNE